MAYYRLTASEANGPRLNVFDSRSPRRKHSNAPLVEVDHALERALEALEFRIADDSRIRS